MDLMDNINSLLGDNMKRPIVPESKLKIAVEQISKLLSPGTEVKAI